MLDNGYALSAVELFNWGNFQGYQKFTLNASSANGPMFAPPAASAILGINGSGKSTLIDGIMMALLPFENSLKLGMTNDSESGGAGGRTIRDYVLGKYSSGGDGAQDVLNSVYGRSDGCSVFILHFTHNKSASKKLTLGRIWWYANQVVNDTQLAFLDQTHISILDLCPDNITPKSPKVFKDFMRSKLPAAQVFETMQAYFNALSSSLGKISRDDLKILNRAFYVKSISQIDNFIRENMLIEHENSHLERLLENVRNGQEINQAIQVCEEKITAIEAVLGHFDRLINLQKKHLEIESKRRLLSVYQEWIELRRAQKQEEEVKAAVLHANSQIPLIQSKLLIIKEQLNSLRAEISQQDIEAQLSNLDLRKAHLQEKIATLESVENKVIALCRDLDIKEPKNSEQWTKVLLQITEKECQLQENIDNLQNSLEEYREKKYEFENESRILRAELDHLSRNKTLIHYDLYQIKQDALQDLKIPEKHLLFVGELIQLNKEAMKNSLAVESVLFPISKSVLCHPDNLNDLTKWLDSRGLKSDITVKRISKAELESSFQPKNFSAESILSMIDVLPVEKNPFYSYIWTWLSDVFDYRLVGLQEFRKSDGKTVTAEGLTKTDSRTMRKLKRNFPKSLGWNNEDYIAELTAKLVSMQNSYAKISTQIENHVLEIKNNEQKLVRLKELRSINQDFLNLPALQQNIKSLERQKIEILKKNPNFQEKSERLRELESESEALTKQLGLSESELEKNRRLSEKLELLLPKMLKELTSSLTFVRLCQEFGPESLVWEALERIDLDLQKQGKSRLQLESELDQKIHEQESRRNQLVSVVSSHMTSYKRNYEDPNLYYELHVDKSFDEISSNWRTAYNRLTDTELPSAKEKWKNFFDQILFDSVKDTINEIKSRLHDIEKNIHSINNVLKLTNFEDLQDEKRYLKIDFQASTDERVRKFKRLMTNAEKTLGPAMRSLTDAQSEAVMKTLTDFVDDLQKDPNYRIFVTDVRNHFLFRVHSLRRSADGNDVLVEIFTGSRKDAKSSAQTTQLAYTLLASCLAYRFNFHDPILGQETPRLIILDEFGGKFDNEKPKDVMKLLAKMGFQAVFVSPMSKGDLLAHGIGQLVNVFKVSAKESKVKSESISSKEDYDQLKAQTKNTSQKISFAGQNYES